MMIVAAPRQASGVNPLRVLLPVLALVLLAPAAAALAIDARVGPLDARVLVDIQAPQLPAASVPLALPRDLSAPLPPADSLAAIVPPASPLAPLLPPVDALADVAAQVAAGEHTAAAGAVAGAGAVWALLGRMIAALYSRVPTSRLLDNERRERMISLVRERPGIGPTQIAEAMGLGWGVTTHHLDRLERAGLVTSQRSGHHRLYFVPGAMPREQQRTVGMFRVDTTRRVAELVATRPGVSQSELCRELGISASAASKQLSRLEAASLVRREQSDVGLRVYPGPGL